MRVIFCEYPCREDIKRTVLSKRVFNHFNARMREWLQYSD